MKTHQSAALERKKFFADPLMDFTILLLIVLLMLFILYPLAMLLLDSVYVQDTALLPLVEVLSACPTNWGLEPQKALEWIDEKMIPYYPLGVYRDKEA